MSQIISSGRYNLKIDKFLNLQAVNIFIRDKIWHRSNLKQPIDPEIIFPKNGKVPPIGLPPIDPNDCIVEPVQSVPHVTPYLDAC